MGEYQRKVFISYSWESDEFKQSIWELAGWLYRTSERGIEVISDHLFSVKPPEIGWHRWMEKEISSADIVLVICTPKYRRYFEGYDGEATSGYGVTHEGLIITSKFYDGKGKNEKFYPVIPDDGSIDNIPTIFKTYYNGLKFSSGNQGIYNLILGENPRHNYEVLEDNRNETILNEIRFENEVSMTISQSINNTKTIMNFDIQILIRSYLSLSDLQRCSIIKKLEIDIPNQTLLTPHEKDKVFLSEIKSRNLLRSLWNEINTINPFINSANPFN